MIATNALTKSNVLRAFEEDVLKSDLGSEFSEAYLKLKHVGWNSYRGHFKDRERQTALDI